MNVGLSYTFSVCLGKVNQTQHEVKERANSRRVAVATRYNSEGEVFRETIFFRRMIT